VNAFTRRLLLAAVAFAVAATSLTLWWRAHAPAHFTLEQTADRNVLLITIDTLRADAISPYGGRTATPLLDRLADRGALFLFAHSHAVVTLPSHTSILTGTYPYEHGVRDNNGYRVRKGQATLATRLKAMGFATGAFVGGFPLDQRFGLNAGFDAYDDRINEIRSAIDFALPERRAEDVVSPALRWIGGQQSRWFAWVHVFDPHAPYDPPPQYAARYPNDLYAAEIAYTDAQLSRLIDDLSRQPRPTLVLVTADHGESLGDHGELTHGIFAYEPTLHVPLIVAEIAPKASAEPRPGLKIDAAVRHVDILPTVLDALGAPAEPGLHGQSLRPLIHFGRGEDRPSYFEAMTANLSRGWAPLRGVIVARDKYIDLPIPELYALAADPREQQNLSSSRRDRAEVMLNALRGFDVAPPAAPGEETSAVRDRLRALGYVGGSGAPPRDRYREDDDPKRLIEIDALLHRAGDLYQRHQPREAVALFQEAIAKRPDTADAYRYLAFVFWETGQPDAAIRTLEAALKNGVSHRDVRVKLGIYLAETGRADRAIALLEGLAGDDIEALNALGIAYGHARRTEDARRTFKHALEIDPTNALAWQNIGTLDLQNDDVAAAEKSLNAALEIDSLLPGAHTSLGVILARRGEKEGAIFHWMMANKADPTDFDALYNLTVTLMEVGKVDEARRYGQQYIATAPPALYAADIERIRKTLGERR
jgi:tetratricopeptide (TPR) repeat protein